MALSKNDKKQVVELALGGEGLKSISGIFNLTRARIAQVIRKEIDDLQHVSQKDYGQDLKEFRNNATEILADLEMYHTGELLKLREQDNARLVSSNKDSLDKVLLSTIFMDMVLLNPLREEGLVTLLDLTNYSHLDLLKTSKLGKLKIQAIIKELERHGLKLSPDM